MSYYHWNKSSLSIICQKALQGVWIQYNHLYRTALHHHTQQKVKLRDLLGTFDAAVGNFLKVFVSEL